MILAQSVEPLVRLTGPDVFDARAVVTVLVVVALLAGAAWWLKRHAPVRLRNQRVVIDTAVSLGERRSLVIVTVEGRRLLLGMTPSHVSLVTELDRQPSFGAAVDSALQAGPPS